VGAIGDKFAAGKQPVMDEYRLQLQREEDARAAEHDWEGKGYKLHPSKFRFGMCIKKYVESCPRYQGFGGPNKISAEEGKAEHWRIQKTLMSSPKAYPYLMCYPDPETAEAIIKKYRKSDEIPIVHLASGISGFMDLPLWPVDGEWTALDIKSTGNADEFAKSTIDNDHRTQLCVYAVILNDGNFYPDKITQIGVLKSFRPEDKRKKTAFKELYEPLAPWVDITRRFIDQCALRRSLYIAGQSLETPCEDPDCNEHGSY